MTGRSHVFIWLCALLASVFASPLLFSPVSFTQRVADDIRSIDQVLGRDQAASIVKRANSMYQTIFFDSGVSQYTKRAYSSRDSIESSQSFVGIGAVASMTNHYLESLSINFYSFTIRLLTVFAWIPLFFPFMIACVIDGMASRAIKLETFRYNAPLSYSFGLHASIFGLFLPVFYLIVPFSVSPWFIPIWALSLSCAMMVMVRNVQRIRSGT